MSDPELPEIEQDDHLNVAEKSPPKGRSSFKNVRRELSDKEFLTAAVQRMLLDEIERLDNDVKELSKYRTKYHDVDKQLSVSAEKLKSSNSNEVLYSVCITIGAALMGYAPSLWEAPPSGQRTAAFVAVGFLLILGGLVSKAVKK